MPLYELDVFFKDKSFDSTADSVKSSIQEDLDIKVDSLIYIENYSLALEESLEKVNELAEKVFIDSVLQNYSLNKHYEEKDSWLIQVSYHTDVTDNVGIVAEEAVSDYLKRQLKENESVSWNRKYFLKGNLSEKDIKRICFDLLANNVIESYEFQRCE